MFASHVPTPKIKRFREWLLAEVKKDLVEGG